MSYFWVNFITHSLERFWGLELAADKPENLKKVLLNSGYSRYAAKKIMANYPEKLKVFNVI